MKTQKKAGLTWVENKFYYYLSQPTLAMYGRSLVHLYI